MRSVLLNRTHEHKIDVREHAHADAVGATPVGVGEASFARSQWPW
jgi:hypothetical protein